VENCTFRPARDYGIPNFMARSIKVHPKKRRGRPATGKDPLVSARLPPALVKSVEVFAKTESITRSDAIRRLLERGLQVWVEEHR
jgi:Ribbon-helix-helix protein, copG family